MAEEFRLSIVAPDRALLDEAIRSVILPAANGYMGALPGHEPYIASLNAGYVEYQDAQGQRHFIAVSGGFVEIANNTVSILADSAERSTEIDVSRAEAELEKARQALRGGDSPMGNEQAVAELAKATARVKVAKMGN
jgi:F-type H+-transporting ATPase subunit epsilon